MRKNVVMFVKYDALYEIAYSGYFQNVIMKPQETDRMTQNNNSSPEARERDGNRILETPMNHKTIS